MKDKTRRSLLMLIVSLLLITGCSSKKAIYYWGDYQEQLYNYYQTDKISPEQQIDLIEKTIIQANAKNKSVPPGLHAHLALLYGNSGSIDKAMEQFDLERQLFPESRPLIDFIEQRMQGQAK